MGGKMAGTVCQGQGALGKWTREQGLLCNQSVLWSLSEHFLTPESESYLGSELSLVTALFFP